jgi:hypothetical protein
VPSGREPVAGTPLRPFTTAIALRAGPVGLRAVMPLRAEEPQHSVLNLRRRSRGRVAMNRLREIEDLR